MISLLDTRVLVDGVETYGTASDLGDGQPTVLDGIQFSWGRATTVDQPDAGSCAFTLRQQRGNATPAGTPLDTVHVGVDVQVWVRGTLNPPDPPNNTHIVDFASEPAGPLNPNRYAVSGLTVPPPLTVTVGTRTNLSAASLTAEAPWSATVWFPIKPFAPESDDWDTLFRLMPGQTCDISGTVMVPTGTGPSQIVAAAVTSPQPSGFTACVVLDGYGQPLTVPADGAWHRIIGTVRLPTNWTDPAGGWIIPGIQCQTITGQPAVNNLTVTQTAPSIRDVLAWEGIVKSVQLKPAGDAAIVVEATCSDLSAALANDTIGDEPWPHDQTVADRTARIQELADSELDLVVDPGLADIELAYKDVDAQPVLGLLQDIATSAGGVLWTASHTAQGTYLWMEDTTGRIAALIFVIDPDSGIVTIDDNGRGASVISAADILLDPVEASQDSTNVTTSVDVTWQLMTGLDPDTNQPVIEEQTVTSTEPDPDRLDRFGLNNLSISTDLTSQVAAENRATRSLEQARRSDWQLNGLTVDTRVLTRPIPDIPDLDRVNITLDLLDGLRRLGMAITILDMPTWLPDDITGTLYIEGGSYTLNTGNWELDLTVSPAGTNSTRWNEMPPTVRWSDMSTSIAWIDTYGVAPPNQPATVQGQEG